MIDRLAAASILPVLLVACGSASGPTSTARIAPQLPSQEFSTTTLVAATTVAPRIAATKGETPALAVWGEFVSQSGDWKATHFYHSGDPPIHLLEVRSADGQTVWELVYEPDRFKWYEAYFAPELWAEDRGLLYYTIIPEFGGLDPQLAFADQSGLYTLDLRSGEIDEILPGGPGLLIDFTLSPNLEYLAYIPYDFYDQIHLHVLEVSSGNETSLALDKSYSEAGSIVWSAQGDALVFAMAKRYSSQLPPANRNYAVARYSLQGHGIEILTEDDPRGLFPRDWQDSGQIVLSDFREVWLLDPETGQVDYVGTPTPWGSPP